MSHPPRNMLSKLAARVSSLFRDQEIYLRSNGEVRFLRISRRVQIMTASTTVGLLGAWALGTGSMLWGQADLAAERAALINKQTQVATEAAKVNAVKKSVDDIASDLENRQRGLEALVEDHFGETVPASPADRATPPSPAATPGAGPQKISGAIDQRAERLRAIDARQRAFADAVTRLADARLARAEAAIRGFGLNPAALQPSATRFNGQANGQGGPYLPATMPRELQRLALTLGRLDTLESALAAIPSGKPTAAPMLTSSYGYRRDPFNGHAAFHAGIDFNGHHGQPILAAAQGRVAFVGQRQGYGNVIDIDHGNGLTTRYAHLSGFTTTVGKAVARGAQIGRMGSTGRSTGTHLHFEVRVNGNPINPRRFLEASQDVLEVQQDAGERLSNVRDRG